MKISLNDGTSAHLIALIQKQGYQRAYRTGCVPINATEEIIKIAQGYLSEGGWRKAPWVFIGRDSHSIREMMHNMSLPAVLCVGLFNSFRRAPDGKPHSSLMYVVWLEDEFSLQISDKNKLSFGALKWPPL